MLEVDLVLKGHSRFAMECYHGSVSVRVLSWEKVTFKHVTKV